MLKNLSYPEVDEIFLEPVSTCVKSLARIADIKMGLHDTRPVQARGGIEVGVTVTSAHFSNVT